VRVQSPIAATLEVPMVRDLMHVTGQRVRPSWGDVVLPVLAAVSVAEGVGTNGSVRGGMALVTWR
jgi:hypothetical protein